MPITPHRILQEAIAAVPAVRYAAGVAGIAAAIAVVASFKLGLVIAVLGVVVMLGMMAALLAFARVAGAGTASSGDTATDGGAIRRAGIMLVWVFTLLTCATGVMVFTVTFFGTPRTWQELVGPGLAGQGSLAGDHDSSRLVVPEARAGRTSATQGRRDDDGARH